MTALLSLAAQNPAIRHASYFLSLKSETDFSPLLIVLVSNGQSDRGPK